MPQPSELHQDLLVRFAAAGDPERAPQQQRYMKSEMPYWGLVTPRMRRIVRAALAEHPLADAGAWESEVLGLWRGAAHREERYAAIELADARMYRAWLEPSRLAMISEMIVTGAWWDYVDQMATRPVAYLLRTYRPLIRPVLMSWAASDDVWLRRTAIISQLGSKDGTDTELLFAAIEASLGHDDFFVRKAIGWALREYSKTAPQAVEAYVTANAARLSALSRREALKVLNRRRL